MGAGRHLLLLLGKNFKLWIRSPWTLALEIIIPLLTIMTLFTMRYEKAPVKTNTVMSAPPYKLDYSNQSFAVLFAPLTNVTRDVMGYVQQVYRENTNSTKFLGIVGYQTEKEALEFARTSQNLNPQVLLFNSDGTNFTKAQTLPKKLSITLRPLIKGGRISTVNTFPPDDKPKCTLYTYYDLVYYLLTEGLTRYWLEKGNRDPKNVHFTPYIQCMPYYTREDPFAVVLQLLIPEFMVLSFLVPVVMFTKAIVIEKETKLKETMILMGISRAVYWLSWFITFMAYFVPLLLVYVVALVSPSGPANVALLVGADGSLLMAFMLCYCIAVITFCILVSTLTNTGIMSVFVVLVLYYGSYKVADIGRDYFSSRTANGFLALIFNGAMKSGLIVFTWPGSSEYTDAVNTWSNFYKIPRSSKNDISILESMLMLLLDSILHLLLAWYIDQVHPGDTGVGRSLCFCFEDIPWCQKRIASTSYDDDYVSNPRLFERHATDLNAGIQLKSLRKVFGPKVAVKGTTLDMYENEITVLLGHNGAGKTVTMGMLTGFTSPTSGTALINGYDIRTHLSEARNSIGLCPQLNVIFDWLTVREHLTFFSGLKGFSGHQRDLDVKKYAKETGLTFSMERCAGRLSGGQKRKLSVGIALVGGSKVVFLDEPTAGMDPAARRDTWGVLKRAREGRTILLTTHYMDEADLLGDRIAIMANGVVQCCGSSMFLKKAYGSGYDLVLVLLDGCDLTNLVELVQGYVPEAKLQKVVRGDATINLPDTEAQNFPELFEALDSKKEELKISSFGISTTSMEEVFLRANEMAWQTKGDGPLMEDERDVEKKENLTGNAMSQTSGISSSADGPTGSDLSVISKTKPAVSVEQSNQSMNARQHQFFNSDQQEALRPDQEIVKKTGITLHLSIFRAIVVKKAIYMWRTLLPTCVQLALPAVILCLDVYYLQDEAIKGASTAHTSQEDNAYPFDLSKFEHVRLSYLEGDATSSEENLFGKFYAQQFEHLGNVETEKLLRDPHQPKQKQFHNHILKEQEELGRYKVYHEMPIGMEILHATDLTVSGIAHYHPYPVFSREISLKYLLNAMVQYIMNDSNYSIQAAVWPFYVVKGSEFELFAHMTENTLLNFFTAILICVVIPQALAFIGYLMVHFLVHERQVRVKHMQVISGADPLTYWLATLVSDYLFYMVSVLLMMLGVILAQNETFVERWPDVLLALLCYGWANLAFVYVFQFLFNSPTTGAVWLVIFNYLSGTFSGLGMTMFALQNNAPSWMNVVEGVTIALLPMYNICACFRDIFLNFGNLKTCKMGCTPELPMCCKETCKFGCVHYQENYFALDSPGIGRYILGMLIQGLVLFVILLLIDFHVLKRIWNFVAGTTCQGQMATKEDFDGEDSDVATERERVMERSIENYTRQGVGIDQLYLVNLYKCYGTHVAVDHLCVGIPGGECFGLLGQNGAGKTTVFKILTGDEHVTAGNAYILGNDVVNNLRKVKGNMGYCPQFDGLLKQMTGRETLTMYARIRGIPEDRIPGVINELMSRLMFDDQSNVLVKVYSGGTVRKLNTAVALMGDPQMLLLDEPSWGMDPGARRQLWDTLFELRRRGHTMVLTSHSMDEAEALCTRISVMVNGQLKCLGSAQHLKNKFSRGYTFIVQLFSQEDASPPDAQPVIDHILASVKGSELFEQQQNYLHFRVDNEPGQLSRIFSLLEGAKSDYPIMDYSVQQTTLEQVFLGFTRTQIPPTEDISRSCMNRLCPCIKC